MSFPSTTKIFLTNYHSTNDLYWISNSLLKEFYLKQHNIAFTSSSFNDFIKLHLNNIGNSANSEAANGSGGASRCGIKLECIAWNIGLGCQGDIEFDEKADNKKSKRKSLVNTSDTGGQTGECEYDVQYVTIPIFVKKDHRTQPNVSANSSPVSSPAPIVNESKTIEATK